MYQQWFRQLGWAAVGAMIGSLVLAMNVSVATSSSTDSSLTGTLVRQLNDTRQTNHLPMLQIDQRLVAAAQAKAETLLEEQRFDHRTTDGRTPWDFIHAAGYHYELAGENLAMDFSSPTTITDAWLASQSHKDNMLDPAFSDVGIAIASGDFHGHSTMIVVELFGRPNPASPIERALTKIVDRMLNEI